VDWFKSFISLLALVNPLGAVPMFISLTTQHTGAERERTTRTAAVAVACVIAVSALLGHQILGFFGISIASLQVGGGILVLLMGISMLNAQAVGSKSTPEEALEASTKHSIAVVPLAVPLLTGPGSISTVIVHADRARGWLEVGGLVASGALIGALVYASFRLAEPIQALLGNTGINIATRLLGLILAALAVEMIADGLLHFMPALGRP